MSWNVLIYFQERGTKKEVYESVNFPDRETAMAAIDKLESDLSSGPSDRMIVVDSGEDRASFIKSDYRRNKLQEGADGFSLF